MVHLTVEAPKCPFAVGYIHRRESNVGRCGGWRGGTQWYDTTKLAMPPVIVHARDIEIQPNERNVEFPTLI